MLRHEKTAFLKFFIIYFLSVAVLILAVGFFYFEQMKGHLLKSEEFSIIEYARHIKMNESLENFQVEYTHKMLKQNATHIDIRNFTITETQFIKLIPMDRRGSYIKLFKSKKSYLAKLTSLKQKIISIQILLLLLFAYISYLLAKSALKPLQESIATLDKFAKDLIHDLNTPVTSIKLNMKILEKKECLENNNSMIRLKKSVQTISELHENLTILLQEETFQMQLIYLHSIVEDVVQTQKQIYPDISFKVDCGGFQAKVNINAIKQILQNIISNACKYNVKNGYVHIYMKENSLYIKDSGKGIEEPDKIFERSYSGEGSSGIGLDIVKRLANAMDIKIEVQSDKKGTILILKF